VTPAETALLPWHCGGHDVTGSVSVWAPSPTGKTGRMDPTWIGVR